MPGRGDPSRCRCRVNESELLEGRARRRGHRGERGRHSRPRRRARRGGTEPGSAYDLLLDADVVAFALVLNQSPCAYFLSPSASEDSS
jgi:hypothetical protein